MKRSLCSLLAWWLLLQPAYAVQFGAGTGSGYPSAVDTVNTRTNKSGGACSSATGSNICAEFTNDLQGAVAAIQAELGTLPKGSYADVKTRLNAAVYSGTAGLSSYTIGDLLYASSTTTLSKLAAVATGNVLRSGGVGVAPAWGQVVLTTDVSGILSSANGGTGIAYFTASGPTAARVYTFPDVAGSVPLLDVANVFTASQTIPSLIGGTSTTSTLTLQSTSGVGASDAIIFKVGNNGATEAGRFRNDGTISFPKYANFNGVGSYGFFTYQQFGNWDAYGTLAPPGTSLAIGGFRSSQWVGVEFYASGVKQVDIDNTASIRRYGSNGQVYTQGRLTELVAVGSGITTKATTIQIPADAVVDAVPVYVVTKPGGTATMTVTATTSGTVFQKGASISTNAGTSDPGNKNTPANTNGTAAQTVTFTFNTPTTDALGGIRVDIYYHVPTPPTS